jgi:S1-C subfamily serine protease
MPRLHWLPLPFAKKTSRELIENGTTSAGGSGGPLFNREGKVIGVNFAILNNFGGSNLAVPIRYADELVK